MIKLERWEGISYSNQRIVILLTLLEVSLLLYCSFVLTRMRLDGKKGILKVEFNKCLSCKTTVSRAEACYCQKCAYKAGICAICKTQILGERKKRSKKMICRGSGVARILLTDLYISRYSRLQAVFEMILESPTILQNDSRISDS